MHTVLRSDYRGLRKFKRPLAILLEAQSKRWAVTLYKYSINSNHVHLCTKSEHSDDYKNFLRTFRALSVRLVTGARKGRKLTKKFWKLPPFSRIIEWGKAYKSAVNYILKNQLEADGVISYTPRLRATASPPVAGQCSTSALHVQSFAPNIQKWAGIA
jgi:hypothetical protein